MSRQTPQLAVEDYAKEVLARIPDLNSATEAFFQWSRHDADVARALGIHWLDTLQQFSAPLKSRIRGILEAASRPPAIPESEEYVRAREEFVRSFTR